MSAPLSKKHKPNHDTEATHDYGASSSDMSGLSVFCTQKGGMNTVDMNIVNKIVHESSHNSAHFKHQIQLADKQTQRINTMKNSLSQLQLQWNTNIQAYNIALHDTQRKIDDIEKQRLTDRWFVHVDLDMFYAACELIDRSDLHDKPVAIGGIGMITTANYVARKYGVRAAMYA